ncbi:MAG: ArsR/SmtB family transcription factor [Bacillota bacterium]
MDGTSLNADVARLGRALSDPKRVALLQYLINPEPCGCCRHPSAPSGVCNCELQQVLGIPQATVSYHVRVLRDAGLITERVWGKWSQIAIDPRMSALLLSLFAVVEEVRSEDSVGSGSEGENR